MSDQDSDFQGVLTALGDFQGASGGSDDVSELERKLRELLEHDPLSKEEMDMLALAINAAISKKPENATLSCMLLTMNAAALSEAGTDSLTGLYNKKVLQSIFNRRVHELKRQQYQSHNNEKTAPLNETRYSLIYIDLDNFKPVNDKYGHQAGDEVLKTVAAKLRTLIRPEDIAARDGGDEFALIVGYRNDKEFEAIIKRLEAAFPLSMQLKNEESVTVGASIGHCEIQSGSSFKCVKNRADKMMYKDKGNNNSGGRINGRGDRANVAGQDAFPVVGDGGQHHRAVQALWGMNPF